MCFFSERVCCRSYGYQFSGFCNKMQEKFTALGNVLIVSLYVASTRSSAIAEVLCKHSIHNTEVQELERIHTAK